MSVGSRANLWLPYYREIRYHKTPPTCLLGEQEYVREFSPFPCMWAEGGLARGKKIGERLIGTLLKRQDRLNRTKKPIRPKVKIDQSAQCIIGRTKIIHWMILIRQLPEALFKT